MKLMDDDHRREQHDDVAHTRRSRLAIAWNTSRPRHGQREPFSITTVP